MNLDSEVINRLRNMVKFLNIDLKPLPTLIDGRICQNKLHLFCNLFLCWTTTYYSVFKFTYPRNKVFKSWHPIFFLAGGLYLPYRFSEHINTYLFALSGSKNLLVNSVVRVAGKSVIYVAGKFLK